VTSLKAAVEEFLVGGLSFPTVNYEVGASIITEGEIGESAFIIQRGYCRVYKYVAGEMRALADLGPGDVFGETAVFADAPRMATVQAISDVTVQVVTKEVFTKDLGVASSMGAFVRTLATRFVSVDRELRSAQDQLRAMAEAQALAPQTPPEVVSSAPPPPPAWADPMPLPPRAASARFSTRAPSVRLSPPVEPTPEVVATSKDPPAPTPSPEASPASAAAPATEAALAALSATTPPPALVAAMARLYGMKLSPEEVARHIVAAAIEAADRLSTPPGPAE
jgi:hypothetical protein